MFKPTYLFINLCPLAVNMHDNLNFGSLLEFFFFYHQRNHSITSLVPESIEKDILLDILS